MDHSGYLTTAYRRYSKKQLADLYQKNMHHVSVYSDVNVEELEKDFDRRMKGTTDLVERVVADNLNVRSELTDLKSRMVTQEKINAERIASLREIMERIRDGTNNELVQESPSRE
jgi:hypothetical protein